MSAQVKGKAQLELAQPRLIRTLGNLLGAEPDRKFIFDDEVDTRTQEVIDRACQVWTG